MKPALIFAFAVLATAGCGASPAYYDADLDPIEKQVEPTDERTWTAAPDDFATPFALGQKWVGKYVCAQGETDMVLHVVDVDGPRLGAIFEFEHQESGAKGMFEMRGRFTVDRRSVTLTPTRWIKQPEGYVTVGMRGTVSVSGKRFLGMVDGPGCTTFALKLLR